MGLLSWIFGKKEKKYEPVGSDVTFLEENGKAEEIDHTLRIDISPPSQQYIIKKNGEYLVFESKDEMDEETRDEVEELENINKVTSSYTVIINGERKTYSDFSEIPEEARKAVSELRKS